MSKQTRFARAFVPWIAEWADAGLSGTQERVMLLLIANMESMGGGRFKSWCPRAEMASALGVSEDAIRKAVRVLISKGMLKRIGNAHNGKVQQYQIMPPKGGNNSTPIIEGRGYQRSQKGGNSVPIKGGTAVPPNRLLEGACAAPSREGRPSAGEIDYGARSAENARRIV